MIWILVHVTLTMVSVAYVHLGFTPREAVPPHARG